ncbi:type III secretion system cytoplasmic ring protein SctQ [Candidatus Protochlamydia phocaeensis]|uniref:type III secretion system cytoplasmic ring protein SctQ n=1 Tax=Candidatus Protochlamydia phocaeensis TaxID=1414722 RepID=UPI000839192F|nr:type III secretion system cytoplasmic ring protein SctQ [Candidatus Protochlamydia phocaeensis]
MATPPLSYDWLREIKPELKALDDIPLTGAAPPFPWEDLSARIGQAFEREGFSIQPKELMWRSKEQLYEGLGDAPFPLTFAIPSLRGTVCWVMPEQEMAVLETWLLTKESHPISFQDRALSESFYRFLALETLYHMSQLAFDKTIAPVLMKESTLPAEDSLCLDISLSFQEQTIWGRLIISPDLRRSWVEYYAQKGTSELSQKMAQSIEVILHIEAGKTSFSLQDWKAVSLGDFVLLDHCSLNPQDFFTGRVMLTINGRLAFRGKLKDGNIKILELPLYHEVNTPMAKNPDEDEDEDDLSDLDLTEDEEDLDLEEEDESFAEGEEEELLDEEERASEPAPTKDQEHPAPSKSKSEGPLTPGQIPVSLTVEVGRIQMTMEKLLQLEPGNLLELDIHPEDGVDLTINGKVVGKGELIRVGESLGVRILEIGH